ncbi:MAG: nitrogenase iron-molybdenum cofactor biosynthesis protein NifE [Candidatus Methanoplasma sp.]|jgi:nitrogenase molybdenum-cofactor synthesis protein NifE|nr:nitrogenase iron-molybdenum cofactor biosynthesis protein NifE [Candidatus Methanoplasma sp.]
MREDQRGSVLDERMDSVRTGTEGDVRCGADSVSGSVSQRACVYCGARVVLNPITDAFHVVHGPIGCASYTWDIRGSLTSGSERYRNSYSTDMTEKNIIFGGEVKLEAAIDEIAAEHSPKLVFVYATCIAGVIGDDIRAVCRRASQKHPGTRFIPVQSPGFSGNKAHGYRLACEALMELMRPHSDVERKKGVNFLGDYNLAGEAWIVRSYLEKIGVPVISTFTGDSCHDSLIKAPSATLNIVQCAGSMTYLAKCMEEEFRIPFTKVSFFGVEGTSASILRTAEALGDDGCAERAKAFIATEEARIGPLLEPYRRALSGKRAAIYVGGGFKAISLVRQFNSLGMKTVMVGTQTGSSDEYEAIRRLVGADAVVLDDANPSELEKFMKEKGADILVGGVKERPLAYKMNVAFCDHNHERRHALAGYDGVLNFTEEIFSSMHSPVWEHVRRKRR